MILRKAVLAVVATAAAVATSASPAMATPATSPRALVPGSCSNGGSIHVYVPYYPNTYCYSGGGSRRINLTQVNSVESRNWTTTVLWKPPGGSWTQTGLTSNQTLWVRGGVVDTISVP
jgi:hypothetical protein